MKKKKYLLIALIIAAGSLLSITLAKYITEDYHGYYFNAKDFEFSSKILSNSGNYTHVIDNWSGVGAFDVTVDLATKKNNLYFTNYDVPYVMSYDCPDTVVCSLDKNSGVIYASDLTHTDTVTLHVQPLHQFEEGSVLIFSVAAQSTFPYVKNLSATYCYFVASSSLSHVIYDDNSVYVKLAIINAISYCTVNTAFGEYEVNDKIDIEDYKNLTVEQKEKCTGTKAKITFNPQNLLIDTTDNIITGNNYNTVVIDGTPYINSLNVELEPASSIEIKFYKTDPMANYSYAGEGDSEITVVPIISEEEPK